MAHKLLEGVDGGQPLRLQPRLLDTDQVSLDISVDHCHSRVSQIGLPLLRKLSNIPYIVGNHPSQTDF